MKSVIAQAGLLALVVATSAPAQDSLAWLDPFDVVWTSQSHDSSESMPCGGGDMGMNVWVEKGELLCYLQRSGCFDENNEYLKLGRLRVRLDPNPFAEGAAFRQELKLRQGCVEISGVSGGLRATIVVWADVFRPVAHIEVTASRPVRVSAAYENWRQSDVSLPNSPERPRFACFGWDDYPGEVVRFRDDVRPLGNTVSFHHRNREDRLIFDYAVRQQGLTRALDRLVNTQKGRTFGGVMRGDGFVEGGTTNGRYADTRFVAWNLRSEKPATTHRLEVVSHVAQTDTLEQWERELGVIASAAARSIDDDRRRTREWWEAFWNRSHIVIDPDKPNEAAKPWQIARNYQLFRYQLGCNSSGEYPTKFNGGNFTFDPEFVTPGNFNDPDFRAWGGGSFTAQNQRLVYWPMLKSGDGDLMAPQLEFYRRALPSALARVRTYYGHGGCLFTEQMENFGLPCPSAWGWRESGARRRQRGEEVPFGDPRADATRGYNSLVEHGEQANEYVSYHYESQLEFSYMALERHRFFGGDLRPYLPFLRESVRFFDEHYQLRQRMRTGSPLDGDGKLVIFPSTGLESYRGARNPADLIAGLNACLESLLALGDDLVPADEKAYYRGFLRRVPGFTYGVEGGDRILKPAQSTRRYQNAECPQFYPLFPFNRFGLGRDDLSVFQNTWKHGAFPKGVAGNWHQDGIFLARMGMTRQAAEFNLRKLENSPRRFPTFWGPGLDWAPDHNWGGSGMIGLQEMLMQTIGRRIVLIPAWPAEWDCDFKLHAPYGTTVQGSVRRGKIIRLEVSPRERMADVEWREAKAG